jgi:maleate isomerase
VTKDRVTLLARLDAIVTTLRNELNVSRTTLRLDDASLGFHIDDVVVEALEPGEKSMRGVGGINHRGAPTGQWVERHRRLLVQDDLSRGEPKAPQGLTQGFGVKAQMLAPVVRDGRLDGWVSVHEAKSTRAWTEADQAAAMRAAEQVLQALES